jgi:hypothetical protein
MWRAESFGIWEREKETRAICNFESPALVDVWCIWDDQFLSTPNEAINTFQMLEK